jgi:sulfate transport system ATP-binding protein
LRGNGGLNGALFEAELPKEAVQFLKPGQTVRLSARQAQVYPDYEI